MERFETVDELAYADLGELTAFIDEKGRNFAAPAAKARALQTAARNSCRLPVTVNNAMRKCDSAFRRCCGLKFQEVNRRRHRRALAFTARELVRLLKDDRLYRLPEG